MTSIRFGLAVLISSLTLLTSFAAEPLILKGHKKTVSALAWAADGKSLISGGSDRTIRTWDNTGKQIAELSEVASEGYGNPVYAFTSDLKLAAINYWGEITIRSMADGKKLSTIDPILDRGEKFVFRPDVFAMSFSPDGKLLATAGSTASVGGRHGLPGGIVVVWDTATGKVVHKSQKLSTSAGAIVWSADGKYLAVGTNGAGGELPEAGDVSVWETAKWQIVHNFSVKAGVEQGEWASAGDVAFSPDGKKLAAPVTAGGRGTPAGLLIEDSGASVRVWDLDKKKPTQPIKGLKASIGRMVFSPDGKQLATAGADKMLRVWDLSTGKELSAMACPSRPGFVVFNPTGDTIAAACSDGSIQIWALPITK